MKNLKKMSYEELCDFAAEKDIICPKKMLSKKQLIRYIEKRLKQKKD